MVKKTSQEWYESDILNDIVNADGWVNEIRRETRSVNSLDHSRFQDVILASNYWYNVPITFEKYSKLKDESSIVDFNIKNHEPPFDNNTNNSDDGCIIL